VWSCTSIHISLKVRALIHHNDYFTLIVYETFINLNFTKAMFAKRDGRNSQKETEKNRKWKAGKKLCDEFS
jgi:hypothetical protein